MNSFLKKIKEKNPVVLCITNVVSAYDVAQAINTLGGSPIMSNDQEDALELLNISQALYLNIGTICNEQLKIMLNLAKAANKKGIPIIVDPVGVGASKKRSDAFQQISQYKIKAIRANYAEIKFIAGFHGLCKGIDSLEKNNPQEIMAICQKVAFRYQCLVLATGKNDVLVYEHKNIIIQEPGSELLPKIIGTGCCLGGLVATCLATEDSLNIVQWMLEAFLKHSSTFSDQASLKNNMYSIFSNNKYNN